MVAIVAPRTFLVLNFACILPFSSCAGSADGHTIDENVQMASLLRSDTTQIFENAVGSWRLSSADTGIACLIALSRFASGDGFGVQVETCSAPKIKTAESWRPLTDGFELVDDQGATVARFKQIDIDAFISSDGAYDLRRAAFS